LDFLEKTIGESADKHNQHKKSAETAQSKIKDLNSQIDTEKSKNEKHKANMEERLSFLENQLGDNYDKHSQTMSALEANHKKLNGAMDQLHAKVKSDKGAIDNRHSALEELFESLRRAADDTASKHTKLSSTLEDTKDKLAEAQKLLLETKASHGKHKATIEERLHYLEKEMGDSADKHMQVLEAMEKKHAKLNGSLNDLNGRVSDEKGTLMSTMQM